MAVPVNSAATPAAVTDLGSGDGRGSSGPTVAGFVGAPILTQAPSSSATTSGIPVIEVPTARPAREALAFRARAPCAEARTTARATATRRVIVPGSATAAAVSDDASKTRVAA